MLSRLKRIANFLFNYKNFKFYWSQVLIITIPIVIAFFPQIGTFISSKWYFIALFVLIIGFLALETLNKSEYHDQVKQDLQRTRNHVAALSADLESTPDIVVKAIFQYLDFGYTERITVYRYANSYFSPVGRYAKNVEFKKVGREKYPYSEGFISLAWNDGQFFIEDLPDPDKKSYLNKIKSLCNISDEVINNMAMKSRSYYCKNLDTDNGDPAAVIVIESTNEKLPKTKQDIDDFIDTPIGNLVVNSISINIPPGKGGV